MQYYTQCMSCNVSGLQDNVLVTGQGLHSTRGGTFTACHQSISSVAQWRTKLSETRHIFVEGGFRRGTPLVLVRMTPFCYHWPRMRMAGTNQQAFCSVVSSVMSHDFVGLCPVPGTDNNAPHWTPHTDAASCFASFEGWTSWKNVKHSGNPRGALLAWQSSNKCVDLRGLTCHWLLWNALGINEKK